MSEQELRSLVTSTGRQLLAEGLVVRTWGNISCRVDDTHFLITPSGLDYKQTQDEDLALYDWSTGEWEGPHKPSSEKGIHAAAYELFEDAGFVIHTHQAYASAISVYGLDDLDITEKERHRLGGLAEAAYGLPGTKMLKNAVKKALEEGNRTVLMKNHGALIIGKNQQDAYERAQLLESICRRNWKGEKYTLKNKDFSQLRSKLLRNIKDLYPNAAWAATEATIAWSMSGRPLDAQLDDMSQMIGKQLTCIWAKDTFSLEDKLVKALEKKNAVAVRGLGVLVNGIDQDDTEALIALADKACIAKLHTYAAKVNPKLSAVDCALMYAIYQKKYSKLKKAGK